MPTETIKILDLLAAHLADDGKPASDYRIAKNLGISRTTVSNWRVGKGTFSDETALKIADLMNENPAYLLALAQSERTESEPARAVYKQIAAKFGKNAATILVGAGGLFVLVKFASFFGISSEQTTAFLFSPVCIMRTLMLALACAWLAAYWLNKQLYCFCDRRSAIGKFAAA